MNYTGISNSNEDFVCDCILGIDPGASGGIAVWRPNNLTTTVKMPRDILPMKEYLEYVKSISEHRLAFVEKVQLQHNDNFQRGEDGYGKQFGIQKLLEQFKEVRDTLKIVGIPFVPVHPMTWQSTLNLRKRVPEEKIDRKNRYKEIAQNLYPECKSTLWNCDALLLVEFGRKKIEFDFDWIRQNLPEPAMKLLKFY
jgi:hypothetical protein